MLKSVKGFSGLAIVALLAIALVACGDNTATSAPAATTASGSAATTAAGTSSNSNFFMLSGATSAPVPDALKAALSTYESQYPGSKAQAFKTSEQPAKVKESLAAAFTKEGWTNVTPNVPDAGGGFALGFTKNNKGAAVVAFPGMMAGLGQNEINYIVFLPQ